MNIIAWSSLDCATYPDYKQKIPIWLSGLLELAGIFRLSPGGVVSYKNESVTLIFCDGGIDKASLDENAKREIRISCLPSLHDSFPQLKKPFTGRIVFHNRGQHKIEEVRIIAK